MAAMRARQPAIMGGAASLGITRAVSAGERYALTKQAMYVPTDAAACEA